ncbi:MAG TPA: hypothetical protein VKQ08_12705 [Cyclobacteriaceae bacterium]|nr:hypothetical protein [Cyclobacteriaceae bacterium]
MKTLIFVAAVLLALSSCTKSVVVPDNSSYYGYYSDPNSPYYDPNYDPYLDPNSPYYDPNYDPYYGNSIKPGSQTVASGKGAAFNPGGQNNGSYGH